MVLTLRTVLSSGTIQMLTSILYRSQSVADGVLYIGFSDGQVYALRAPTVGIQVNNQSTAFLMENQNMALLIVIVVVLVSALITLIIVRRNKRSKGNK